MTRPLPTMTDRTFEKVAKEKARWEVRHKAWGDEFDRNHREWVEKNKKSELSKK